MPGRLPNALYRVVCAFVPPEETAHPEQITLWRFKLFALSALTAAVLAVHLSLAYGVLGAGFAANPTVLDIQAQLVDDRILQAQERFCSAMVEGNFTAQRYARERRDRLRREYLELTGEPYQLPSCEELGYSRG